MASTLYRGGGVFRVDAFRRNAELAGSVHPLQVVGFYLMHVGYIAPALTTSSPMANFREIIELESVKIGMVLSILGAMHFRKEAWPGDNAGAASALCVDSGINGQAGVEFDGRSSRGTG
jgi:hypothetical protein